MSKTRSSQAGLTRRSFLKAGGAGALGLAAIGGMTTAESWLAPAEAHAEEGEKKCHIYHNQHCTCTCALTCTVRDGRLTLVEPHQNEDKRYENICLKGLSEVQHVYAGDRVQTPLKRVGKRGEGEFQAISWDEALKYVADSVKAVQEKYGKDSLLIMNSTESLARRSAFLPALLGAQTGGLNGLDRGQANGVDQAYNDTKMNGKSPNTLWEWTESSLVINLSGNMLESGLVFASKGFFEAQEAGTKIVTVDPRYSLTASKSDQWIPIKPGTDPALILGLIEYVIDNELYDEDYMIENTSFPFLISSKAETILDCGKDSNGNKIPIIWDSISNAPAAFDTASTKPSLDGEWDINGEQGTTQFTLLKKQMSEYTLDWTSEKTGISSDVIAQLASEYAKGPSIISYGFGGIDKFGNGDIAGHAYAVLAGLTGNYGRIGTGVGLYSNGGQTHSAALGAWTIPTQFKAAASPVPFFNMPTEENAVKAALFFGDAPAQRRADAQKTIEWIEQLDFVALCDIYHTSTADWMDVILPVCTKFEAEEKVAGIKVANNHVLMLQKVLDPLFESHTDFWIEKALAKEFGLDQHLPESFEELARTLLTSKSKNMAGITLEALEEHEGMIRLPDSQSLPGLFRDQVYKTKTKKQELYYEKQIETGQAFPAWEEPLEAYEGNTLTSQYPFVFNQIRSKYRIHSSYCAATWLQQMYEPCVEMNPQDAKALNLSNNDDVEVYNGRGSFCCKLVLSNEVRPNSLCMIESSYRRFFKSGIMQNVTNQTVNPRAWNLVYGPQILFNDVLVAVKKA